MTTTATETTEKKEGDQFELLLGVEIEKRGKSDLWKVDPRTLVIDEGFNTRVDYGDLDELCNSIMAKGIQTPLKCYKELNKELFHIVDGHRRHRAVLMALDKGFPIKRVPIYLVNPKSIEDRTFDLLIHTQEKPLTISELADTVTRLVNYGFNVPEISKQTGIRVQKLYNFIEFTKLAPEVRSAVDNGTVALNTAIQISKEKGSVEANLLIKDAITHYPKGSGVDKVSTGNVSTTKKITKTNILDRELNGKKLIDFVHEIWNKDNEKVDGDKYYLETQDEVSVGQHLLVEVSKDNKTALVYYAMDGVGKEMPAAKIPIAQYNEDNASKIKLLIKNFEISF